MSKRILLIEDSEDIANMVKSYLSEKLYGVTLATDGEKGIELFNEDSKYDLILLDIMLPKKNGLEVMEQIRRESTVPIIIISARDLELDKTMALDLGADDYITKPFSLAELDSRIKASLRRTSLWSPENNQNKVLIFLDLSLDIDNCSLTQDEKNISLTATEFEILKMFLLSPDRTFTKGQIYSSVWKDEYYGDESIINVHISRLREKLGDKGKNSKYIETLWGIGYRLRKSKSEKI